MKPKMIWQAPVVLAAGLAFALTLIGCPTDSPVPTVTGVTVNPATANVARGQSQNFTATVSGTNNHPTTVAWTVAGGVSGTAISSTGRLTVAANETATTLVVRATSTHDTSVSGTATVTVTTSAATVTGITVSPVAATVARGGHQDFTVSVAGTGSPPTTATWTVTGGGTGTTISPAGRLTITANETATTLTVRATSTHDTSVSGTATVTVSAPADPADIGWIATVSGSPASNAIVLRFNSVPTGLLATDLTVTAGTGSATIGALTGTGTERNLAITDVSAGTVSVAINRAGIAPGPQTVTLVGHPSEGNDNDNNNDNDVDNDNNGNNILGGRLFAQAPPILPSATPIDLSEITDWMGRDTVVDRAVAYANANPGIFTLVLDDDIDVSGSRQLNTANVNLTVIGNGERAIRQTESGSIFDVGIVLATAETNISLTLGENVILVGRQGNTVAAVTVRGGATLTMRDNAIITGNTAGTGIIGDASSTGLGGGVFMQGVPGGGIATTFTMRDNALVHWNSRSTRGGGVFVDENTVFNMYDNATVSGNSITAGFQRDGGGVYVGGIFNMHGGTISGNTAGMFGGGGVHVGSRGTFVMSGGTVYGNDVPAPLANDASSGAALLLGSNAPITNARFGDGTNILPHTDGNSRHTNNTITGRLTAQGPVYRTVTFYTHGGIPVPGSQEVREGTTATRPAQDPVKIGHTFVDWFTAETGGSVFDFNAPVTVNTTIHARWTVQEEPAITWTATPFGSPTTTAINFTFSAVPSVWLDAWDVTIGTGTGFATRGTLTGTGTTRSLAVSSVRAGTVSVYINRAGIALGPQTVTLVHGTSGGTTQIDLVRVQGGTFEMGNPEGTPNSHTNERPVRPVTLSGFYMSQFEVTQGQWYDLMGTRPSGFTGATNSVGNPVTGVNWRNLPVESVSWYDAEATKCPWSA